MGRGLLLLVSGFLIIFGIIQRAVHGRQEMLTERAPEYYYQEQSRNIAGAMLEITLGNLNENYLTPESIDNTQIDMLGGTGKVEVEKTANFNSTVYVKITGAIKKIDNKTSLTTINAIFNRKAFSIYAYFTDYEPSNYVFVTGDEYNGPVHTNGRFNWLGDPVFNGPVTSHQGTHDYNGRSNPVFNNTHDFDADNVPLPTDAPDVVNLAKSENGGIGQFDKEITVKFNGNGPGDNNGTVDITTQVRKCVQYSQGGGCSRHDYVPVTETHRLSDFNDVISSKEDIHVEGVLDGQVTLYSEKEVHITGDMVYENRNYNDKSKPISDDMLGIVSGGNTVIDKDAEYSNYVKEDGKGAGNGEDHGHGDDDGHGHHDDKGGGYGKNNNKDIFVDASVLTMNGRFMAEDFNKRGRDRGTVHLLGGAIQRTAGAMGLVNGSNGHHLGGYSTNNWNYDTRFAKNSTPGFPRKTRFEIENWRESSTTIPNDN